MAAIRRRATWTSPGRELEFGRADRVGDGASVFGPVFTGFAQWVHERARGRRGAAASVLDEGRQVPQGTGRQLVGQGQLEADDAHRLGFSRGVRQGFHLRGIGRRSFRASWRAFAHPRRRTWRSHWVWSHRTYPDSNPSVEPSPSVGIRTKCCAPCSMWFSSRPALLEKVVARSARRRIRLKEYLRRVAGPGDGPIGLVDVGWSGRIQESLEAMFDSDDEPLVFSGLLLVGERPFIGAGPPRHAPARLSGHGRHEPVRYCRHHRRGGDRRTGEHM